MISLECVIRLIHNMKPWARSGGVGSTREMAHWKKCLLCKFKDPSSDLQNHCKRQAVQKLSLNPALGRQRQMIPGTRWLTKLAGIDSQMLIERLS